MRTIGIAVLVLAGLAGCGGSTDEQASTPAPAGAPATEAAPATAGAPAADAASATDVALDRSELADTDAAAPGVAAAAADSGGEGIPLDQTTLMKPWTGDFDGMVERRMIRALVPYSKTLYFVDLHGAQRGIAHDYMKAFEDDLNARLKTGNVRVHVVFIPTTRDHMLEMLDSGRGDIAVVDATISPEGMAVADFTTPIASGVKEVVVTGKDAPPIASLDDLAGKTVFVRPQSSREIHLRELSDQLVARGLAPIDIQPAAPELEPEDMLEMVNAGLLPAVVVNRYYGEFWSQIFTDIVVRDDLVVSEGNDVGFGMRKGSPLLKAELDTFLAAHKRGTTFGNVTLQKYLKSTKWVRNATNAAELEKFRQLIGIFQKYSEEYGVDWILMAAQGYQESQLDQSVRSPVGAIGVMQLMPATGAEMKVGDILEMENNIRGGVKYVRWVMDEFYKDEPMTQTNKMLFAFASYNAGPGRVRGLRRVAAERGLDPNVWFNNVEHVAAEKIGRETVQYVSNIYKYYVAYKLVNEQAGMRKELEKKS